MTLWRMAKAQKDAKPHQSFLVPRHYYKRPKNEECMERVLWIFCLKTVTVSKFFAFTWSFPLIKAEEYIERSAILFVDFSSSPLFPWSFAATVTVSHF
jgi:hypothetical protein